MNNAAYMESSQSPCQMDELTSAMRTIKRHPQGHRGIHFHFSLLDRAHKQPYHRRTIATTFNPLIQTKNGQLFWASNFDMIFICKDCTTVQLDTAILAAIRAIEDSPVLKEYIETGRDNELCDWYDLKTDRANFMEIVESLKAAPNVTSTGPSLKSMVNALSQEITPDPIDQRSLQVPKATSVSHYVPKSQRDSVTPMGPMQLDQLERTLITMDVFSLMAHQTAYVIVGDQTPQPLFVEYFIAVAEIQKKLLPNYDILADKWLFQRLTRSFDLKLLQELPQKDPVKAQITSININVETVFTPEFDQFMAKFKQQNSHPLILEMALFDVISDIQKYYDAREKLAKFGCRICLDAVDPQSLAVLDRELLAVDFIKITWKPQYKKLIGGPMEKKIISTIQAMGKMRIILCHCDTKEALDFGKFFGIHIYQGFWVDKKIGPL